MIYLDNSSTTHKKPPCIKISALKALTYSSVNPSRGGYKLAIKVNEQIFNCRELLAETFGTIPENVIFTSGCTMSLNLAINGCVKKNGHIITTVFEHNSVLRVLEHLKNSHNITYTILKPNKNGLINNQDIIKNIKSNTYMVIVNHTSNVTGDTQNIKQIGKICKKHNLIFLVDGAQSVGHEKINMQEDNINLLTIAGHKGLYSSTGIGALLINNVNISPLIMGGTGTFSDKLQQPRDYPDGLESGTQNILGILTLYSGLKYVIKNQEKINKKIQKLTSYLLSEINRIKNIECHSTNTHSGVVSFTINNKDSVEISNILDEKYNILTRSGLHCAPLIHRHLGTLKSGMTRISLSYFSTKSDIKKTLKALKEIALN